MSDIKNHNIQNETLLVGSLYKNPDIYIEYGHIMRPKYDFYDSSCQFFYTNFETMYKTFSQDFNENNINIFMSQDKKRNAQYKEYGSYKTIEKMMELSNTDDFKNYFNTVKKFSLIREYERNGYPIQKILEHKKFDLFTANDIYKMIKSKADVINTVISGGEESILLGKSSQSKIKQWIKKPSFGITFPWYYWNIYFRGFRKSKLIVEGMLSNEGKSRKMVALATHISLIEKKSVLIMTNEMSEEDIEACKIITVINNPIFKDNFDFELNKTEEEIVLGRYRSDNTGHFIVRELDENENPILTDEEYEAKLFKESIEYRNTLIVAQWIEENTKIYFKEMREYSDYDLEMEIRKHVLSKNVEYIMYDTLKGYKTDDWGTIKQTATRLEELAKELKIGIYANFQLTDDSVYLEVFDLNSMNLANCKQIFHVLDYLVLGKRLFRDDYDKYSIIDDWGGEVPLDINKTYYGHRFAKSRTGGKGKVTVCEVDLDRNIWTEVGILIKKGNKQSDSKPKQRVGA